MFLQYGPVFLQVFHFSLYQKYLIALRTNEQQGWQRLHKALFLKHQTPKAMIICFYSLVESCVIYYKEFAQNL